MVSRSGSIFVNVPNREEGRVVWGREGVGSIREGCAGVVGVCVIGVVSLGWVALSARAMAERPASAIAPLVFLCIGRKGRCFFINYDGCIFKRNGISASDG